MFGIYSRKRLSENESKILKSNPDDYNWYHVMLQTLFEDDRFFQVREDIEVPKKEGDDGVVLILEGGDVVYFRTIDGNVNDEVMDSIIEVCSYLVDKFDRRVDAYVVCPTNRTFDVDEKKVELRIRIYFSSLAIHNGEEIIERLENKLKNHEEFTISDSIDHMLLPYTGYQDKKAFEEKYQHYMNLIETYEDN